MIFKRLIIFSFALIYVGQYADAAPIENLDEYKAENGEKITWVSRGNEKLALLPVEVKTPKGMLKAFVAPKLRVEEKIYFTDVADRCLKINSISKNEEIIIGYSKENSIQAVLIVRENKLVRAKGTEWIGADRLHALDKNLNYPFHFVIWMDSHGPNSCVYEAWIDTADYIEPFTLFSNTKSLKIDFELSEEDKKIFYSINKTCVEMPDAPPGQKPPCRKPRLVATSDLNGNGRKEYWYEDPYMWDSGFAVDEINKEKSNFMNILSDCSGCSD